MGEGKEKRLPRNSYSRMSSSPYDGECVVETSIGFSSK